MSRRLLASYLTLAAIVLLALEIPLGIAFARNERQDLTTRIERDAVVLASLAEPTLRDSVAPAEVARVAGDYARRTRGRAVVVTNNGDLVVDTDEPNARVRSFESRPEIGAALDGNVATGIRRSNDLDQDLLYVAVPVASGGVVHGAVRITFPTAEIDARVRRSLVTLIVIAAVVLGLVALVGWRFARAIAGPLSRVERATAAAGAGDLSVRAPVAGPPEVRSLATGFNTMVTRLADLVRSQEVFVADASHQLRTPLAALRLRLENLESDVTPEGRADVEAAVAELDRLNRLVTGLLVLARSDAGPGAGSVVDASSIARERVELWTALAEEGGVRIVANMIDSAPIRSVAGRLDQVLDNLIENALAASPQGTTVAVTLARRTGAFELHVTDQGPGMSAEERGRAFDRFWRSPRTTTHGTGLGLAIVKRLVEADSGTIELRATSPHGLDVVVWLPAAEGPPRSTDEPSNARSPAARSVEHETRAHERM